MSLYLDQAVAPKLEIVGRHQPQLRRLEMEGVSKRA